MRTRRCKTTGRRRRSQHRVLQWKELRRKLRIKKKWQPGVPALPPERQSKKNDFSDSFGETRNHFVPPGTPANIPPKEEQAVSRPERREGLTNCTPWIVGACLTGGVLMFLPRLRSTQTRGPAGPVDSEPKQRVDKPPRPDRHLKPGPDPFYME